MTTCNIRAYSLESQKNSWNLEVMCGKISEMVHEVSDLESGVGKDEKYIKMLVGGLKDMWTLVTKVFNWQVNIKRIFMKCAGRIGWICLGTTEGDEFNFKWFMTMHWWFMMRNMPSILIFFYYKQRSLLRVSTSRHSNTTSAWTVSPYTQHINTQFNTNDFNNSWSIKDQLDTTYYFISLLMYSTCFGH